MRFDRWTIRRFRDPHLEPIALWDACLEDETQPERSVYTRLGRIHVERLRREGLDDTRIATTLTDELVQVLRALHGGQTRGIDGQPCIAPQRFERAFIEGRVLELTGLRAALANHDLPFDVALAPPRPACIELGAEQLLRRVSDEQAPRALVVDIGHTVIRTVSLGRTPRHLSFERNFDRLPLARGSIPPPSMSATASFVSRSAEFVGRAMAASLSASTAPIILSFPCSLDPQGTPGRCTYPGWEGNETVAPRMVESMVKQVQQDASGERTQRDGERLDVWLISHAELVALATEAVLGPARAGGTLALAVGFGPSAAILRGEP
ncbi:MAG: hypothetical protein ACOC1F_03285 [Myxococcota bacterium]